MVDRSILKCHVCGSLTMIRTQIGYLERVPLRVYCGNCGILMSGTLLTNPYEYAWDFVFNNATRIPSKLFKEKIDYYIEASAEFVTKKLIKYDSETFNESLISPFIRGVKNMGFENYEKFNNRLLNFSNLIKHEWPKVRRINELWVNGNYDYIEKELKEVLHEKDFPCKNELDSLVGVHKLNLMFFGNVINEDKFIYVTNKIEKTIQEIISRNKQGISKLTNYFGERRLLRLYEQKIFLQLNQFVSKFEYFIPVFGLQFYKQVSNDIFREYGITTASFEDIKDLYIDTYEIALEIYYLVIAFNNLNHRNDFKKMKCGRKDIEKLSDFENVSKGARLSYLTGDEEFDMLLYPHLDNKIRNAIGHNSYKYDGVSQLISYVPGGKFDDKKAEKKHLLEFAYECWNLFLCLVNLSELVYIANKIYYMSKGIGPSIDFKKYIRDLEEINN